MKYKRILIKFGLTFDKFYLSCPAISSPIPHTYKSPCMVEKQTNGDDYIDEESDNGNENDDNENIYYHDYAHNDNSVMNNCSDNNSNHKDIPNNAVSNDRQ